MVLAGRCAEHDGPPAPPPAVEPGPEATEEAAGDHAGPMLDRDVERALAHLRPMVRSAGRHDVQVDLVQLGAGGRAASITLHEPRASPATSRCSRRSAHGARRRPRRPAAARTRRRRVCEGFDDRGRDLPGPRHLARLQHAEADVPVHRHVVHAEQVGDLLQRERASGLCRHPVRTLVLKTRIHHGRSDRPLGSASPNCQPCLASQRSLAWRLRSSRWAGTRESPRRTALSPRRLLPHRPPGASSAGQLERRGHEALAVVGVQVLDDRARASPR